MKRLKEKVDETLDKMEKGEKRGRRKNGGTANAG